MQACMLLGAIQVVEMDSATESIFYTIACRMAMILDLPNAPAKTRMEQEVGRRGEYWPHTPQGIYLTSFLPLIRDSMVVCSGNRHVVIYGNGPPQGDPATL